MQATQSILLVGPTGSGKTPLGDVLDREGLWGRRCCHFDFGWTLRRVTEAGESRHYLTREEVDFIRSVLRSGALLEDRHFAIAEKILRAFIAEHGLDAEGAADAFLVLNGLPRHAGQAQAVDAVVDVRAVIELRCTPEAVLERIRTNTGGDRVGRGDDDPESVRRRLVIFSRRTAPLVEHYRRRSVRIETVDVDANTSPEDVWAILNRRA